MNIVPFELPVRRRVAAKLACLHTSALSTAAIDVLADIRPRRTDPQGFDMVITPENNVFVVRLDADDEARADLLGTLEELRQVLEALGRDAELTEAELRWLHERVGAHVVEELITAGEDQGDGDGCNEHHASAAAAPKRPTRLRLTVVK